MLIQHMGGPTVYVTPHMSLPEEMVHFTQDECGTHSSAKQNGWRKTKMCFRDDKIHACKSRTAQLWAMQSWLSKVGLIAKQDHLKEPISSIKWQNAKFGSIDCANIPTQKSWTLEQNRLFWLAMLLETVVNLRKDSKCETLWSTLMGKAKLTTKGLC